MLNFKEMPPSTSSIFSAYASFAASMMLIRSVTSELFPPQLTAFLSSIWVYFFGSVSLNTTLIIEENCGYAQNQVFEAAEIYLRTKISPFTDTLKVSKTPRQKKVTLSIEKGQEIIDHFDNIRLKWRFVCSQDERNGNSREKRHFELVFAKKFRDRIVDLYFPYILKRAKEIKDEDKVVKIFSQECQYNDDDNDGRGGNWGSINLDHPATFDTLAMDPELKKSIVDDLDRFVKRRDFYKRVGKAWKRGYLLYGPPGTGKSSLIAAMANYLKFDIFDLDLTNIYSNSDLKRVLLGSKNRSILVIEDIDCSVDLQNRQNDENFDRSNSKFTLSGMLNFIDGLWSSCGDERIIIFTTNHKDRLDPALLRPGRMDVHINMSYCSSQGFKVLATNYLGDGAIRHRLYGEIEELIDSMEVSPAEIAEELMKSDDADVVLEGLAKFLKRKKEESSEEKEKEEKEKEKEEDNEEEEEEIMEEENQKRIKQNSIVLRLGRGRGRGRGWRGRGRGRSRRGGYM